MTVLLTAFVTVFMCALVALILIASRYKVEPKNLKFPFADFDISKFDALSSVILFNNVSKAVIRVDANAQNWLKTNERELSPLLMVHLAWQVVCDSFAERYSTYPTEEGVQKVITQIGSQNVDFIINFKKFYEASIKYGDQLPLDLATAYFLRAPSLARRISPDGRMEISQLYDEMRFDVERAQIDAP